MTPPRLSTSAFLAMTRRTPTEVSPPPAPRPRYPGVFATPGMGETTLLVAIDSTGRRVRETRVLNEDYTHSLVAQMERWLLKRERAKLQIVR